MPTISELRHRAFLTQRQLADGIGVRSELISCWERGVYKPRATNILNLCEALKCERHDIEFPDKDDLATYSHSQLVDLVRKQQGRIDTMHHALSALSKKLKTL
jgi:DNA-binding XRE family transcriptional regulator